MMKRIKIKGVKALQDGALDAVAGAVGTSSSPVHEDDDDEEREGDDEAEVKTEHQEQALDAVVSADVPAETKSAEEGADQSKEV